MLGVQAHTLLVDADLALDTGAALGLLQAQGVLALAGLLLLLRAADACLVLHAPALLGVPRGAIGCFFRSAVSLGTGADFVLFLLDAIVLDPAQLPQRKQNRVCLTWTFGHGHLSSAARARGLINFRNTIRHRVQRTAPRFMDARGERKISAETRQKCSASGRRRSSYLYDASNLSMTSSPFFLLAAVGFLSSPGLAAVAATVGLLPLLDEL